MDKDLIKMRDAFKEIVEIMDEILDLEVQETSGKDVKKETESATGRLMFKMIKMKDLE
ncbi:hypothetical protein KTC96_24820 (plasmid) [Clostridium estertheticum]|uniref:hypothetical protein n=1 Tax=Clostridium estertheticum TaxID=238834 RepID=UPI001C7D5E09|nr:hypothetical protein [Clostridium estertheticum]MBX4259752.1 hypothetical protein [Clostridium estertheticum]WLC73247.1 hypothetical protein KTC96_24820 [Clostridium estertheticum]